jgi:hypothetical protein
LDRLKGFAGQSSRAFDSRFKLHASRH